MLAAASANAPSTHAIAPRALRDLTVGLLDARASRTGGDDASVGIERGPPIDIDRLAGSLSRVESAFEQRIGVEAQIAIRFVVPCGAYRTEVEQSAIHQMRGHDLR